MPYSGTLDQDHKRGRLVRGCAGAGRVLNGRPDLEIGCHPCRSGRTEQSAVCAQRRRRLYGCSEIHRHLGFYYLEEDVRPREALRQLERSLALRERLGDPRRTPSALVALGEAEMAAGRPRRAAGLLSRAVTLARQADLLQWRIQDAEQNLRRAEAAVTG